MKGERIVTNFISAHPNVMAVLHREAPPDDGEIDALAMEAPILQFALRKADLKSLSRQGALNLAVVALVEEHRALLEEIRRLRESMQSRMLPPGIREVKKTPGPGPDSVA